jgi:hypothetical protein
MNYIQIDINGQKVGLKFGYPQAKEFAIALAGNVDLYFEGEEITAFGLAKLFHSAYKNDCYVKEVKPELPLEVFSDWVDTVTENELAQTQMLDALNIWQESKYTKLWIDNIKKKTAEIISQTQAKPKGNTKRSKQPSTQTGSGSGS